MEKPAPNIVVRSVWAYNFVTEFHLIDSLSDRYSYVAIDTEFPGTYYSSPKPHYMRTPEEHYAVMKKNVDELHLIQLGLALFDAGGNLPLDPRTGVRYVWEFNFRDFDLTRDRSVQASINVLVESGIDLYRTRRDGVPASWFAHAFMHSRLACARAPPYSSSSASLLLLPPCGGGGGWVTFQGAYDFGYLMKVITGGRRLPDSRKEFLEELKRTFGSTYDIKCMARGCGIVGSLEKVAESLGVKRQVGRRHQAGSDSLVVGVAFAALRRSPYFVTGQDLAKTHAGRLYDLEDQEEPRSTLR